MAPRRPNAKAEAAKERKAAHASAKKAQADKEKEKLEAAEWKKGSNARGESRSEAAAKKADEAARKRREKAELLAAEEAESSSSSSLKPKKSVGAGMTAKSQKKKNKKKSDLSLLEETLVGNADKQSRAAKKAERERKEREERIRSEKERKRDEQQKAEDPLLLNTDAMIGGVAPPSSSSADGDDDGDDNANVGRKANVASMMGSDGTGIDGALSALAMTEDGKEDSHPEKRMKALHKAFEERMMPEMKRDYPGLRMGQYKDKIFALWKKSPENPMNQIRQNSR